MLFKVLKTEKNKTEGKQSGEVVVTDIFKGGKEENSSRFEGST
jgi:hypothetical protein